VSRESLLKSPTAATCGKATAWWRRRPSAQAHASPPIWEDRNTIVAVQWMVAIATSYLVFAVRDWNLNDPLPALLILICLISAPLLQRILEKNLDRRIVESWLLVVDSILIIGAITLAQEVPWDLLILFFFCVFIAAIGENLIHIGLGCVLLSLAFMLFASPSAMNLETINPNTLFRVPFVFGISIFYGHLASAMKQEKKRAEKIEEASRLKRQMACALAHDMKTPLNVILGHAELLAEPGERSTPTQRLSSFKCIRENIDSIVKLITDFLDVARLETSKLPHAVDLVQMNAVAEDVVMQQMIMAREKNLKLALKLEPDLPPTSGDFNELHRALSNLVSNAIKFTPTGGHITVSSQMAKNDIAITVKDSGSGIPKDDLAVLFSEFRRLRGAANSEGTGLGLFIVKTIIEAHGGTVAVESQVGIGTTFTIILPAAKKPPRVLPIDVRREPIPERCANEAASPHM
jgi:signal transduction histidine kinase